MRSRKSRNDFRYSANIITWYFPKAGWRLWKITIYAPEPKRKMVSTNAIIQPLNPDWITWNIQKFPHSFHIWGVFRKQRRLQVKDARVCYSAAGFWSVHSIGPVSGSPSGLFWPWSRGDQQVFSVRVTWDFCLFLLSYVYFVMEYHQVLI